MNEAWFEARRLADVEAEYEAREADFDEPDPDLERDRMLDLEWDRRHEEEG